ncbi:toll/interleukin-1 receptor domain-containing protein [Ignatzschineria cameli]|uniref:toll/interleukin-1 receptor domain-containing protein n=1 Tax=Ignatzschineria cameli TaxID=2182793 RepID=UPI000D62153A|nr:toll/interleukin-1 receptor domain-containing protein [Ignatzschineria cameli]PWD85352.1 hypothetical protein DC080_06760 [Ignatzschineria cameli]
MFKSIQIKDFCFLNPVSSNHEIENYKNKNKATLEPLEHYLLDKRESNIFSADKIQEKLFSEVEADIFLSHAHADEDEVIQLAIYLEKNGLNVFVDSCVWGNVFDLLHSINNTYSEIEENLYCYNKCLSISANVYMILNTALHRIIDQTELFLFLGTENSTSVSDMLTGSYESVRSPWIYSELRFANQVRRINKRKVITEALSQKLEGIISMDSMPKFDYSKPDLDYSLSNEEFNTWLNSIKKNDSRRHPLDELYSLADKK